MAVDAQITLPLHRLDVETYNKIVDSGALEGERVELLDGALVEMSPQSAIHSAVIEALTEHFAGGSARLRVQLPLEVPPASEPEPDLALLADRPPQGQHPRTALLVVEVAVTSQLIDRNVKAGMYARASIPTYWLVDVPWRTVEVRTEPGEDGYRRCATYAEGELVPCPLDGVADLDVTELLDGVRC